MIQEGSATQSWNWLAFTLAWGIVINPYTKLMGMKNDSHALQHPLQFLQLLRHIFRCSNIKNRFPKDLPTIQSSFCDFSGWIPSSESRQERKNEDWFRREQFSPKINSQQKTFLIQGSHFSERLFCTSSWDTLFPPEHIAMRFTTILP